MKLPEISLNITYSDKVKKSELHKITSSKDCVDILRPLFDSSIDWREEMVMLCLNRANKVIAYYRVSVGGTTGTVCDPKIIFSVALNCLCSSIILCHNHPSGNLQPSNADNEITKKIKEAGKLLEITLLDHIIITDENYYSYADEGKI
jgi:DNA repair protein RadC